MKPRGKEEWADAVIEVIKSGMEPVHHLPRCEHDSPLSDWSGEWQQPDCGCNFDTVDDRTKKVMAMLKLQGKGIENV